VLRAPLFFGKPALHRVVVWETSKVGLKTGPGVSAPPGVGNVHKTDRRDGGLANLNLERRGLLCRRRLRHWWRNQRGRFGRWLGRRHGRCTRDQCFGASLVGRCWLLLSDAVELLLLIKHHEPQFFELLL